jgi:hypothetical protein
VQRGVISVQRVSAAGKVQVIQVFIPATPLRGVSGFQRRLSRQRAGADAERSVSYSENGICGAIAKTARACIADARFNEPASARVVRLL